MITFILNKSPLGVNDPSYDFWKSLVSLSLRVATTLREVSQVVFTLIFM